MVLYLNWDWLYQQAVRSLRFKLLWFRRFIVTTESEDSSRNVAPKHYILVWVLDAVVIYGYVSKKAGAEFQNITENTIFKTRNFTAAIISDCERTSVEDTSPERRFHYRTFCRWIVCIRQWSAQYSRAFYSFVEVLKQNEDFPNSRFYVTAALIFLTSPSVSNICHQANLWRGKLLCITGDQTETHMKPQT